MIVRAFTPVMMRQSGRARHGGSLAMRKDEGFDGRPEGDPERAPTPQPASGVRPKQVIIGAAVLILLVFAAVNFVQVKVNFLVFSTQARVVTVIVVSALLGFVAGYFSGRPTREDRKRLRHLRDHDEKD
jgi:uncharacterized integral membrane protein